MKLTDSLLQYKEVCGIYKFTCTSTSDCYIGSSCNIQQRFFKHRRELRKGVHKNEHLQNAYNKHGELNFSMSVVEQCDVDVQFIREQYHIDTDKPKYNKEHDVITRHLSDETKVKLSEAMLAFCAESKNLETRYREFYQMNLTYGLIATHRGLKPSISIIRNQGWDVSLRHLGRILQATPRVYKGCYWSYNKELIRPSE